MQKKVNVRVSSSYSTRQKIGVRGIYNASCTHTTRSSALTNKNAGISIWANSGGIVAGIGEVVQEAIGVIGVFA